MRHERHRLLESIRSRQPGLGRKQTASLTPLSQSRLSAAGARAQRAFGASAPRRCPLHFIAHQKAQQRDRERRHGSYHGFIESDVCFWKPTIPALQNWRCPDRRQHDVRHRAGASRQDLKLDGHRRAPEQRSTVFPNVKGRSANGSSRAIPVTISSQPSAAAMRSMVSAGSPSSTSTTALLYGLTQVGPQSLGYPLSCDGDGIRRPVP